MLSPRLQNAKDNLVDAENKLEKVAEKYAFEDLLEHSLDLIGQAIDDLIVEEGREETPVESGTGSDTYHIVLYTTPDAKGITKAVVVPAKTASEAVHKAIAQAEYVVRKPIAVSSTLYLPNENKGIAASALVAFWPVTETVQFDVGNIPIALDLRSKP